MYYEDEDEPLRVQTNTLNDEPGQVSYVFSDKTGTLTSNLMEFRKACIGGRCYGKGVTEIGIARMKAMGQDTTAAEATLAEDQAKPKRYGVDKYCNYTDGSDEDCHRLMMVDVSKGDEQARLIKGFCLNMALNHTVSNLTLFYPMLTCHHTFFVIPSGVRGGPPEWCQGSLRLLP